MKKWIKSVLVVGLLVVIAAGAYLYLRPDDVAAADTVATATAEIASLSASASSAGNIQAHQEADVSFGDSGSVKTLNVAVGDRVKAGDLLAELDTSELALSLRSSEIAYQIAQDEYAQTLDLATESEIATARAKVQSAQAAYDELKAGPSAADLATAKAQPASAQASYNAAVKSADTSDTTLISAAGNLEKARIVLEQAQGEYDRISWRGDAAATSQAQELQSATIHYEQAKASYDASAATADTDAQSPPA